MQTVWNKLYRKNVVIDVPFLVGMIHEDEFWTWQVIARAKRVVTVKESYYNYLQRGSSIMGAGFTEKRFVVIQAKTERQKYIEAHMPRLKDTGWADMVFTCMYLGIEALKAMGRKDAARWMKYLKDTVKSCPISKGYLRTLRWKQRLHLWMIRSFFKQTCLLHSLRG